VINKKCKATTKSGRPCNAYALTGEKYCYTHSTARGAERAAARKLGGLHRQTKHYGDPASIPEKIRTLADVLQMLDYVLKEIVGLENGINRARAFIALSEEYINAIKTSEFEARIAALEKLANEKSK
jgi:hypothetical protein